MAWTCEKFGRGLPSLEGNILLGRFLLVGDGGTAVGVFGRRVGRAGDSARGMADRAGEAGRVDIAGDAGRATREIAARDGLFGRGTLAVRRATPGARAGAS